jgi:hypothetical protein
MPSSIKFEYTEDKINWADVINDGTFLMAASKATGTNPSLESTAIQLCFPNRYLNNFDKVIELLRDGKYK